MVVAKVAPTIASLLKCSFTEAHQRCGEWLEERHYHEAQQHMVDEVFADWRIHRPQVSPDRMMVIRTSSLFWEPPLRVDVLFKPNPFWPADVVLGIGDCERAKAALSTDAMPREILRSTASDCELGRAVGFEWDDERDITTQTTSASESGGTKPAD